MKSSPALLLAALTALLPITGCQTSAPPPSSQITGEKLDTRGIVYVAIPPDAMFKKDIVLNSGRITAELLRDNFAKHAKRAYIGRRVENFNEAVETARQFGCTYAVYPEILAWEDRTTEFSGIRDKAEVKIQVVEAASGTVLHSTVISGRGPWMTSGGDAPKDILVDPITKYVAGLFQRIHMPTALPR